MDREKKPNTTDTTDKTKGKDESSIKDLPAKKLSGDQEENVKGGLRSYGQGEAQQLGMDEV